MCDSLNSISRTPEQIGAPMWRGRFNQLPHDRVESHSEAGVGAWNETMYLPRAVSLASARSEHQIAPNSAGNRDLAGWYGRELRTGWIKTSRLIGRNRPMRILR